MSSGRVDETDPVSAWSVVDFVSARWSVTQVLS